MISCKSCQFCGFNRDSQEIGVDICGIDGKNLVNQAWHVCDRYARDPGADELEEDTIEYHIMDLCEGADMTEMDINVEIEYG